MRNVLVIAEKELKHYFISPIAYAVAIAILLLLGLLFYVPIAAMSTQAQSSAPGIQIVLSPLITLLLFFVPGITMRTLSEENKTGTLELLLTAPVRDWEVVVGKWLGAFGFVCILLAVTWFYPIVLNQLVQPGIDQGTLIAGYLGMLLLSATITAIGVMASSFFGNQIAALFVTWFIMLGLTLVSYPAQATSGAASDLIRYFDLSEHLYTTFMYGIINLKDIAYFLSLTALSLFIGSVVVEVTEVALMTKQDLRRFAPWGLYLSAAALLASGVIYILERRLSLSLQISLAVIILGIALFVTLDPARALAAFKGRQARYGSNAFVMTIAFIGILVLINYLVFQNNRNWDLTEDQQNTLAPETINTLGSLKNQVTAKAFFSSQYPIDSTTRTLLDNLKLNGKGKFTYEVIDPIQNPVAANEAKITRDGTIVLVSEGRMESVTAPSEQEVTAAIIRLENPGERAVYFLTGHGEHDVNGTDQKSYAQIKTMLASKNYTINPLDLLSNPQVPDDARVVVVAGPTKPLSEAEVGAIQAYLDKGGALIYLTDPIPSTNFGTQPDLLANYLQQAWGITLGGDVIIDLDNQQQPLVAIGSQFGQHAISNSLKNLAVGLPIARSVSAAPQAPEGITLTQLASTAQNSWGETNFESINQNQVAFDQASDTPGPVPLAVTGVNSRNNGRVVVIGDSDFSTDQFYQALGNSDLFVNSVDWSAQEENMINLTPKQATQRLLVVPNTATMGLILIGSVFLLPGLFLLLGITAWIQRRQRG